MKKTTLLISVVILISSCAGVKLYSDESLSKQTGLKFYYPKPYLLVERNGAKDVPLKITIIYLPDLSNPIYAKIKNGWGSSEFSIALTNGALSSYGLKTDSKIPETITAGTGALTGVASLFKKQEEAQKESASIEDLSKAAEALKSIEDQMNKKYQIDSTKKIDNIETFKKAISNVTSAKLLSEQKNPEKIKAIIDNLDVALKTLSVLVCKTNDDKCNPQTDPYNNFINQLKYIHMLLAPSETQVPVASFELYEIKPHGGTIQFSKISLP